MTLSRNNRAMVCALLLLALAPGVAVAQAHWLPRLQLDNDVYNYWQRHTHRPDEEYTNGVRASLVSDGAPWWGREFAGATPDCARVRGDEACRSTVVTLAQDLYTPNLDRAPYLVDDWELERPYFAWLYVSGSARIAWPRVLRTATVALGVTGEPAGGELAQEVAHRIGFNEQATGWETQVGFEPGIIVEWRQALLAGRVGGARGLGADLAPDAAISVGNVRSHGEVGGTLRIGWNLSHPWYPGAWRGRAATEWWVGAGGRVEYVARDMSLDGTLRNPGRRVERVPGVRQYEFSAGLRVHGVSVEYRAVTRTREYATGPAHHTYSSMIFGMTK